jgi:activator of 2-hydroxyglutaryl-CoA dehydratase
MIPLKTEYNFAEPCRLRHLHGLFDFRYRTDQHSRYRVYRNVRGRGCMYTIGLDSGSTTTKGVLFSNEELIDDPQAAAYDHSQSSQVSDHLKHDYV